jgi:hypothetical protein
MTDPFERYAPLPSPIPLPVSPPSENIEVLESGIVPVLEDTPTRAVVGRTPVDEDFDLDFEEEEQPDDDSEMRAVNVPKDEETLVLHASKMIPMNDLQGLLSSELNEILSAFDKLDEADTFENRQAVLDGLIEIYDRTSTDDQSTLQQASDDIINKAEETNKAGRYDLQENLKKHMESSMLRQDNASPTKLVTSDTPGHLFANWYSTAITNVEKKCMAKANISCISRARLNVLKSKLGYSVEETTEERNGKSVITAYTFPASKPTLEPLKDFIRWNELVNMVRIHMGDYKSLMGSFYYQLSLIDAKPKDTTRTQSQNRSIKVGELSPTEEVSITTKSFDDVDQLLFKIRGCTIGVVMLYRKLLAWMDNLSEDELDALFPLEDWYELAPPSEVLVNKLLAPNQTTLISERAFMLRKLLRKFWTFTGDVGVLRELQLDTLQELISLDYESNPGYRRMETIQKQYASDLNNSFWMQTSSLGSSREHALAQQTFDALITDVLSLVMSANGDKDASFLPSLYEVYHTLLSYCSGISNFFNMIKDPKRRKRIGYQIAVGLVPASFMPTVGFQLPLSAIGKGEDDVHLANLSMWPDLVATQAIPTINLGTDNTLMVMNDIPSLGLINEQLNQNAKSLRDYVFRYLSMHLVNVSNNRPGAYQDGSSEWWLNDIGSSADKSFRHSFRTSSKNPAVMTNQQLVKLLSLQKAVYKWRDDPFYNVLDLWEWCNDGVINTNGLNLGGYIWTHGTDMRFETLSMMNLGTNNPDYRSIEATVTTGIAVCFKKSISPLLYESRQKDDPEQEKRPLSFADLGTTNLGGGQLYLHLIEAANRKTKNIWWKITDKAKKNKESTKKEKGIDASKGYKSWFDHLLWIDTIVGEANAQDPKNPLWLFAFFKSVFSFIATEGSKRSSRFLMIVSLNRLKLLGGVHESTVIWCLRHWLHFGVCAEKEVIDEWTSSTGEPLTIDYRIEKWNYIHTIRSLGNTTHVSVPLDPSDVLLIRPVPSYEESWVMFQHAYSYFFYHYFGLIYPRSLYDVLWSDSIHTSSMNRTAVTPLTMDEADRALFGKLGEVESELSVVRSTVDALISDDFALAAFTKDSLAGSIYFASLDDTQRSIYPLYKGTDLTILFSQLQQVKRYPVLPLSSGFEWWNKWNTLMNVTSLSRVWLPLGMNREYNTIEGTVYTSRGQNIPYEQYHPRKDVVKVQEKLSKQRDEESAQRPIFDKDMDISATLWDNLLHSDKVLLKDALLRASKEELVQFVDLLYEKYNSRLINSVNRGKIRKVVSMKEITSYPDIVAREPSDVLAKQENSINKLVNMLMRAINDPNSLKVLNKEMGKLKVTEISQSAISSIPRGLAQEVGWVS